MADDDLRDWLLRTVGVASSVPSAKRVIERLVADAIAESRVRDARGDDEDHDEAALGSMWTIMQTQFERGRIPECHGPTRDDARKMLAGLRRVAACDAR